MSNEERLLREILSRIELIGQMIAFVICAGITYGLIKLVAAVARAISGAL